MAVFRFVLLHGGFENEERLFRGGSRAFRVHFNAERNTLVQWMLYSDTIAEMSMDELVVHMTAVQQTNALLPSGVQQLALSEYSMSPRHADGKCPDHVCPE